MLALHGSTPGPVPRRRERRGAEQGAGRDPRLRVTLLTKRRAEHARLSGRRDVRSCAKAPGVGLSSWRLPEAGKSRSAALLPWAVCSGVKPSFCCFSLNCGWIISCLWTEVCGEAVSDVRERFCSAVKDTVSSPDLQFSLHKVLF